MNGRQIDRERDGFWWIGQIDDAVKRHAYDCTCQVGGVDAMSIDTDWLRHAARTIHHEHRAMAERAQIDEARIKAVEDVLGKAILRDGTEERELARRIRRALEG